jgi:hypothetical protein
MVNAAFSKMTGYSPEAMQHELEQLASLDTLTGFPNRRLFHDRLEQVLLAADRRPPWSRIPARGAWARRPGAHARRLLCFKVHASAEIAAENSITPSEARPVVQK